MGEKLFEMDAYPAENAIKEPVFTDNAQQFENDLERNQARIKDWEYCYCASCKKIKFSKDLKATEEGICCSECGNSNLEPPAWVNCPHHKDSIVKCPRGGKGIRKTKYEYVCQDHCYFRV